MDLDDVTTYRASMMSRTLQAAGTAAYVPHASWHTYTVPCGTCIPANRIVREATLFIVCCNFRFPRVSLEVALTSPKPCNTTKAMGAPRLHSPEEEIALGPACWLWDYLRRSGLVRHVLLGHSRLACWRIVMHGVIHLLVFFVRGCILM